MIRKDLFFYLISVQRCLLWTIHKTSCCSGEEEQKAISPLRTYTRALFSKCRGQCPLLPLLKHPRDAIGLCVVDMDMYYMPTRCTYYRLCCLMKFAVLCPRRLAVDGSLSNTMMMTLSWLVNADVPPPWPSLP